LPFLFFTSPKSTNLFLSASQKIAPIKEDKQVNMSSDPCAEERQTVNLVCVGSLDLR
jgi:hypothetical protein